MVSGVVWQKRTGTPFIRPRSVSSATMLSKYEHGLGILRRID